MKRTILKNMISMITVGALMALTLISAYATDTVSGSEILPVTEETVSENGAEVDSGPEVATDDNGTAGSVSLPDIIPDIIPDLPAEDPEVRTASGLDAVSENVVTEDEEAESVSVDHITIYASDPDLESPDINFVMAVKSYVKDTDDKLVKAFTVPVPEDTVLAEPFTVEVMDIEAVKETANITLLFSGKSSSKRWSPRSYVRDLFLLSLTKHAILPLSRRTSISIQTRH